MCPPYLERKEAWREQIGQKCYVSYHCGLKCACTQKVYKLLQKIQICCQQVSVCNPQSSDAPATLYSASHSVKAPKMSSEQQPYGEYRHCLGSVLHRSWPCWMLDSVMLPLPCHCALLCKSWAGAGVGSGKPLNPSLSFWQGHLQGQWSLPTILKVC